MAGWATNGFETIWHVGASLVGELESRFMRKNGTGTREGELSSVRVRELKAPTETFGLSKLSTTSYTRSCLERRMASFHQQGFLMAFL